MFASNSDYRIPRLSRPVWTRVLALAFGGLCIASTHGDPSNARVGDDTIFCGRCIDWADRIHLAAADPTRRFGVGPAHPTFEDTPWHAQVVREGTCLWKHGICYNARGFKPRDPAELTEALAQAVAMHDVAELAGLAELPEVRVVAERSAVQVVGCDGQTIVGHVPADPALLQSIEALPAASQ